MGKKIQIFQGRKEGREGGKKMVKIGFLKEEPIVLAAVGVKISQTPFEKGDIQDIYEDCRANREESRKLVNEIMTKHRHLILGDFLPYAITLEDISRLAAIYFWQSVSAGNTVFGAGIEASLRVVKPNRYNKIVSNLGRISFEAYERAVNLGVPEQDARYMLPEGTLTRMIFSAPPRYLAKLANHLQNTSLPELEKIGKGINKLVQEKFGLEFPYEPLPSRWHLRVQGEDQIRDEEDSLDFWQTEHSISLNMRVKGSLAMYAQLVRQRLNLCVIEPFEAITRRGRFVIPPTFPEIVKRDYRQIAEEARQKQIELLQRGDMNFVYFLLLGQQARAMIYGKGFQVIETSRARSEGVAQWEIRNAVGIPLTRRLAEHPDLRAQIGPDCWRIGKCFQPSTFKTKKNVCRAFAQSGGNWKGTLEELLEILSERYETFAP